MPSAAVFKTASKYVGECLALMAGAALTLAFAPFDFYPLAVLCVALLFALWLDVSAPRAFVHGALFGLGLFGAGVYWIYISIYQFGHTDLALALLITVLFIAIMALFTAVAGLLAAGVSPNGKVLFNLLVLFPAAWMLLEWLRGWLFTGFPWLVLGYSQIDSPLAGLAPLGGVYAVSWATALSAGLLVAIGRSKGSQRLPLFLGLLFLWSVSFVLGTVQWTQSRGERLRVSLIQGNIVQDIKWLPEQRQATLELYLTETRAHWDSNLIVWPEAAIPALFQEVAKTTLDPLQQEASARNTDLLIGIPVADVRTGRFYNSVMSVGTHPSFYHKRHLVPFGEYLPLRAVFGDVIDFLAVPMPDFSPGPADQPLLKVAGVKVGVSICYEDAFGEEVITTLPEAALLVNMSNDAWFGDSLAPHQHLQMARMRALETGRYLLRSTNTGISAIIGPAGDLDAVSPQFRTHVLTGSVQPMAGATPYVRFGNIPVIVALVVALAMGPVRHLLQRRVAASAR
jgi:apolipoprotein N-acyltransferase